MFSKRCKTTNFQKHAKTGIALWSFGSTSRRTGKPFPADGTNVSNTPRTAKYIYIYIYITAQDHLIDGYQNVSNAAKNASHVIKKVWTIFNVFLWFKRYKTFSTLDQTILNVVKTPFFLSGFAFRHHLRRTRTPFPADGTHVWNTPRTPKSLS